MLIGKPGAIPSSEITPKGTYLNRRNFHCRRCYRQRNRHHGRNFPWLGGGYQSSANRPSQRQN